MPQRLNVRFVRLFQIVVLAVGLGVALPGPLLRAQEPQAPTANPDAAGYILPPPSLQHLFETDKSYATLDYMSPDGDHFLVPRITELSTLDLMSRTTYRLAELELRSTRLPT